jgi:hypothetical protein
VDLALPTDNDAIFRGGGPDFYQYVERDYHGEKIDAVGRWPIWFCARSGRDEFGRCLHSLS